MCHTVLDSHQQFVLQLNWNGITQVYPLSVCERERQNIGYKIFITSFKGSLMQYYFRAVGMR